MPNFKVVGINLFYILFIGLPYYFLPLTIAIIYDYINGKFPKLALYLISKDNKELQREDEILPGTISFIQAIVFIKGFLPEYSDFQVLVLIGFIGFIFYRVIGYIRKNSFFKYYSSIFLIFTIFMDIGLLLVQPLTQNLLLKQLSDLIMFDMGLTILFVIFLPIFLVLGLLQKMLYNRYNKPNNTN